MARKSFTLQKLSTEEGSYLQYATNKEATVTNTYYDPDTASHSYITSTPHGFAAGDTVTIAGTTPSSYNYTGVITGVGITSFYFVYVNRNPRSALGTDGSTTFGNVSGTSASVTGTWSGVSGTTNYSGSGAVFTIQKTGSGTNYAGNTIITVTNGGSNYAVGDAITIPGASLGGTTPTNNLSFRVATKSDGLYVSGGNVSSEILGLDLRVDSSGAFIDDSKLKADGLLVAPILNTPVRSGSLLPYASFFSAEVSDYEEIILTWDAPLNNLALAPTSSTVVATALLISYSEDGEPPTVSDGTVIVSDATSKVYYHQVPFGRWAYYTMFVKFESRDGDLYYEPTAKLAVLTPNKYNSVDDLYRKIPEYYRNLDDNMSTGLGGPLYRYLSIFGFEIDKVRTELDFMISMKDPQLANSEVLDYLAQDLGVDLQSHELGAGRLRNLMNIIGYLRRSEGTIGSLEYAMQAITGSDIEIDTVNKVVKVFAQRVNLLKDPNLDRIIAGLFDGGSPSSSVFSLELDAGVAGTSTFTTTYDGGTPDATGGSTTGDELWNYDPDLSSGGSISVLQTISNYIPVTIDDDLYFSVQSGTTSPAQDSITKVALYANGPYGSTAPLPVCVAQSTTPTEVSGTKYWKLSVPGTRTNLITNPSFGTNTTNWASAQSPISASSTVSYVGTNSLLVPMSSTSDTNVLYTTPSVTTAGRYVFSMYCYIPASSTLAGRIISVNREGGTATVSTVLQVSPTLVANSWVRVSVTLDVAVAGSIILVIRLTGSLNTAVTRTNLIVNPSFEVNTVGWSQNGSTNTRVPATWGTGNYAYQIVHTGTGLGGAYSDYASFVVTAGQQYTASFYAKSISGTLRTVQIAISWYNAVGALLSSSTANKTLTTNSQRWSVTATAPATATSALIYAYTTGTGSIGDTWQMDSVLVEAHNVLGDYFDGSTNSDTSWTGTANNSTSTYAAQKLYFDAAMLEQSNTINDYFDGSMTSYASWSGTAHASTSIGGPSLGTYKNTYLAIFQESEVDAQQHFNSMLLERAANGNYFNGDTSFGGWLVDGNTISDYRWYNPAAPNSASAGLAIENFSVYNSNYQKTRAVANRFLTNLLPVTQLTTGTAPVYSNGTVPDPEWTITFNHIPGVTYP